MWWRSHWLLKGWVSSSIGWIVKESCQPLFYSFFPISGGGGLTGITPLCSSWDVPPRGTQPLGVYCPESLVVLLLWLNLPPFIVDHLGFLILLALHGIKHHPLGHLFPQCPQERPTMVGPMGVCHQSLPPGSPPVRAFAIEAPI